MGTSLKGKNLLPEGANSSSQRERILCFKSSYLRYGKSLSPHKVRSIGCYYFLLRMCIYCVMGSTPVYIKMFERKMCTCDPLWSSNMLHPFQCCDGLLIFMDWITCSNSLKQMEPSHKRRSNMVAHVLLNLLKKLGEK